MIADASTVVRAVAYLVAAVALLVLVIGVGSLIARGKFSRFDAKLGSAGLSLKGLDAKLDAVVKVAGEINKAVNCVPPGTDTLVTRVGHLESSHQLMREYQIWESHALRALAENVGVVLPPPPSSD